MSEKYDSKWIDIRKVILIRDDFTCQNCKKNQVQAYGSLHVHHKDRDISNNDDNNLITLCCLCHKQVHKFDASYKSVIHRLDKKLFIKIPEPFIKTLGLRMGEVVMLRLNQKGNIEIHD